LSSLSYYNFQLPVRKIDVFVALRSLYTENVDRLDANVYT